VPQSLLDELRSTHGILRRGLAAMRGTAVAVAHGASGTGVRDSLDGLRSRSLLSRFRSRCLGRCQLVHLRHGGQDALLFRAVHRDAPYLDTEPDRLIKGHRAVSDLLDDADTGGPQRLVGGPRELSECPLDHLDREEELLAPAGNSWRSRPFHV
jgi:hypothetical protein